MRVRCLNPDAVRNIQVAHGQFAAVCYGTPEKYAKRVGQSCMETEHMSGSRCEYIKFEVDGVDRGTAEQCLRHEIGVKVPFEMQDNYDIADEIDRIANVPADEVVKNMASFRYIDKDGFKWVVPGRIEHNERARARYGALMEHINRERRVIKSMLEKGGVSPAEATEAANFCLPRATTTAFAIGFTPEALMRFCNKRLCVRAQEFARELAQEMRGLIWELNRPLAERLVPQCEHYLWCPEGKRTCGRYPTKEQVREMVREARGKEKEENAGNKEGIDEGVLR